jgi:hypothetical protein
MFDLVVEFSDMWLRLHRNHTSYICYNMISLSSGLANVFLYTDTPTSLCGISTMAACDHVNHGFSLFEAQYKRECILRKYLQSSENRSQWVLNTEQDTLFDASTIAKFMNTLLPSDQPMYMMPVIGAFFVSTRTCIERAFNDVNYSACKHSLYVKKPKYAARYRGSAYNNDHLIHYCFKFHNCVEYKPRQDAVVLNIYYNKKRTTPSNDAYHVIHHYTPSSKTWSALQKFTEYSPNVTGFRIKYRW